MEHERGTFKVNSHDICHFGAEKARGFGVAPLSQSDAGNLAILAELLEK
jgi:hypothetical protein